MMPSRLHDPVRFASLAFLGLSLVAVLVFAKPVIMPVVFALVLAFALSPIVRYLEQKGLGTTAAVIAVVTTMCVVLMGGFVLVGQQFGSLVQELPSHTETVKEKVESLRVTQSSSFSGLWRMWDEVTQGLEETTHAKSETPKPVDGETDTESREEAPVPVQQVPNTTSYIWGIAGPVLEPLGTAIIVIVMVVFLLIERSDLRNRILAIAGPQRFAGANRMMGEVGERLGRYLLCLCAVNFTFAVLFGIALWLLGVPYPLLWGTMTGVLRFIPYIGSSASMLFPATLAFATQSGWGAVIGVVCVYVALEFSSGNFIEPLLFGKTVGLNPVGVLISLAFWTWAWGLSGLMLAMPLTLSLVVVVRHVPQLGWLSTLLGNEPPLPDRLVLYQRLLAGDVHEALKTCKVQSDPDCLIGMIDATLVPALGLAKRERAAETINEEDYHRVLHSTRGMLQELISKQSKSSDTAASGFRVTIIPLPSDIDEVLAEALTAVAATQFDAYTESIEPSESPLPPQERDVYLISALLNHNMPDLIRVYRELRETHPEQPIVIVYWKDLTRIGKLRRYLRTRMQGPMVLCTSARQAIRAIQGIESNRLKVEAKQAQSGLA